MDVRCGDRVQLPDRYGPLAGMPGVVVDVADGWAMVDCEGWGLFGLPASGEHAPDPLEKT